MNTAKRASSIAALALAAGLALGATPASAQGGTVAAPAQPTLYQQLGGAPAIAKVVDDFIAIVAADPRINFQFAKTNIARLKILLQQQFGEALGGPEKYTGRDMKAAHVGMGVTNAQFNALAEDLYEAMDKNGVPYRTQNVIMALLAPMQRDIVER